MLGEERPCTAQHREKREEGTHRAKLIPDTPWIFGSQYRVGGGIRGLGKGVSLFLVPLLDTNPPCFVSTPDLRWEDQTREVSRKQVFGKILFLELLPDRQKLGIRSLQ